LAFDLAIFSRPADPAAAQPTDWTLPNPVDDRISGGREGRLPCSGGPRTSVSTRDRRRSGWAR